MDTAGRPLGRWMGCTKSAAENAPELSFSRCTKLVPAALCSSRSCRETATASVLALPGAPLSTPGSLAAVFALAASRCLCAASGSICSRFLSDAVAPGSGLEKPASPRCATPAMPPPANPCPLFSEGGAACSDADSSPVQPARRRHRSFCNRFLRNLARRRAGACGLRCFCLCRRRPGRSLGPLRRRGIRGGHLALSNALRFNLRHLGALLHMPHVHINRHRRRGGQRRGRSQGKPPASPPGARTFCRAPRSGRRHNLRARGFLRQRHHLPAPGAHRQVLEHFGALPPPKRLLGKRVQALRAGMKLVLALRSLRTHGAACSWNASVCEFCSSFFRFTSTSRGSAPSASWAARRLMPPRCRFLSTCFLVLLGRAPQSSGSPWLRARRARAQSAARSARQDNKPPAKSAPPRLRSRSAFSMARSRSESSWAGVSAGGCGAGASTSSSGSSRCLRR